MTDTPNTPNTPEDAFITEALTELVQEQGLAWQTAVYAGERFFALQHHPDAPEAVQGFAGVTTSYLTLRKLEGFVAGFVAAEQAYARLAAPLGDQTGVRLAQFSETSRKDLRANFARIYGGMLHGQAQSFRTEAEFPELLPKLEEFATLFYAALSEEAQRSRSGGATSADTGEG
jgi:hypothetical protein